LPDSYRELQTGYTMGSTDGHSLVSGDPSQPSDPEVPQQTQSSSMCGFIFMCTLGVMCAFALGVGGGQALPYVKTAMGLRGSSHHELKNIDPFDKKSPLSPFASKDPSVKHFYMYRVQNDEDYSPENQNMANVGGALWYLHNEIIWHHWNRGGTYASTPKTRVERFLVATRAPDKLLAKGMNFGVVNTYDLGQCTGPFACENLQEYGPAVGCESWTKKTDSKQGNNFPHSQWKGLNKYPNAMWYSLPGRCSSKKFWNQTGDCEKHDPSGECPPGVIPSGERTCTYSYQKVGEILINELEGIDSFSEFVKEGGREYDRMVDGGKNMDFWNKIGDPNACQQRIDKVIMLFLKKYPDQPVLHDPICDFDVDKFYPHFPNGTFDDLDMQTMPLHQIEMPTNLAAEKALAAQGETTTTAAVTEDRL